MNYNKIKDAKLRKKEIEKKLERELYNIVVRTDKHQFREEVKYLARILNDMEKMKIDFPIEQFRTRYVNYYARLTYKQINWIAGVCDKYKIEYDRVILNKMMEKYNT